VAAQEEILTVEAASKTAARSDKSFCFSILIIFTFLYIVEINRIIG
jgi:hypothetical protein